MQVLLDLKSRALKPSRALGPVVRHCCEALVAANRIILAAGEIPSLYLSGVRYRNEPGHWMAEHFDNAATVNARGWGDCDDLASWRCAELLNQGIKAGIVVSWKPTPDGKLYHVTVRMPDGMGARDPRTGRWFEDPSAKLGMRSGRQV